jgi:hypothetical protein
MHSAAHSVNAEVDGTAPVAVDMVVEELPRQISDTDVVAIC